MSKGYWLIYNSVVHIAYFYLHSLLIKNLIDVQSELINLRYDLLDS